MGLLFCRDINSIWFCSALDHMHCVLSSCIALATDCWMKSIFGRTLTTLVLIKFSLVCQICELRVDQILQGTVKSLSKSIQSAMDSGCFLPCLCSSWTLWHCTNYKTASIFTLLPKVKLLLVVFWSSNIFMEDHEKASRWKLISSSTSAWRTASTIWNWVELQLVD